MTSKSRGYLKSKVYRPKPHNMEELKNRIMEEIQMLDPEMITRDCRDSLRGRCERFLLKARLH